MKIRIKGNSLRLRLSQSEVERFGKEGYVEETTAFADNILVYALELKHDIHEMRANFTGQKICMQVPEAIAKEWVGTSIVGCSSNMQVGSDTHLFLLLEKDFKCIDGTMLEDQSDNFENPLKVC